MNRYVCDRLLGKVDFWPDSGRANFILFFVFDISLNNDCVLADRKL